MARPHARAGSEAHGEFTRPLLTQTAEYALRAMTVVAVEARRGPVSAAALARATGVPRHYLSKILRRLVIASLLDARRGHGGGFTLARPAELITFADVVSAVGHAPDGARCAFGWSACNSLWPCPLHPAFTRLDGAVSRWLRETTLYEVARPGAEPPIRPEC